MDPELQALEIRLAETALRNTATQVFDKVTAVKARRRDAETIQELTELVQSLLEDKAELQGIASSYQQLLTSRNLTREDINYINQTVVPVLLRLVPQESQADGGGAGGDPVEVLRTLLSPELITIAQLLGFNFREAIGKPLTRLVAALIEAKGAGATESSDALQRMALRRELLYMEIVQDPEAFSRMNGTSGD